LICLLSAGCSSSKRGRPVRFCVAESVHHDG
jgi:hypothetical protein